MGGVARIPLNIDLHDVYLYIIYLYTKSAASNAACTPPTQNPEPETPPDPVSFVACSVAGRAAALGTENHRSAVEYPANKDHTLRDKTHQKKRPPQKNISHGAEN